MATPKPTAAKKAAATEAAETTNTNTGLATAGQYNWLKEKLNEDTGELEQVERFKYTLGAPREYRFDAKNGVFTVGANSAVGSTLKVKPIAWAIYTDELFGQPSKLWAELYFIDDKDCVSVIMFHGPSAQELQKLAEPLYYDDKGLNDVIIEIYATEHTNTKLKPQVKYWIARFDRYEAADAELVKEQKAYARSFPIFRKTSWTPKRQTIESKYYYDQAEHAETNELGTGAEVVE
jgi:hypothetical protein